MRPYADFLNHGVLPFVGRERESDDVFAFWRGTFEATQLRAMLLIGEAGVGKSRLLDKIIAQIEGQGGSVVHVKLYADSTISFIALVARALWHPSAAQSLLAHEPDATLASVTSALQRLVRLRPTMFVVEDMHLLAAEAVGDLARLLESISDDTVSLLALARPVDLAARAALEPYLVDEISMHGLTQENCAQIWGALVGESPGDELAAALHEATTGNPLALRSALRSA
ncbi:MAG: ATP-binding protein, partial [bacterium]|nr:ATP-binding protein [Candidatus Kapabacteria bacterium]